ncbi:MAG TPA: hypothetical protein PKM44_00125 [Turneriella sp.]|nr:hypothetical protein [Turneriella sp.]HNA80231.1 hypothetical protein [Turneriella sp.]HNE21003.1 hypothetical protein [Turneriella sp.]HNL08888.1 hypothetical protein [Turneriella sp.]HNL55702.1 hypothetical protein [Turneriella sp.]
MEVKRSDMLKWAQNAQMSTQASDSQAADRPAEVRTDRPGQVNVDSMRSKILSLQQEIRELQTGISMRQIQLGFLNQVNEGGSWQKDLRRFMNEQFPTVQMQLGEGQNIDEYRAEAAQVVSSLRNNLIKKEIQIQNILSAGLFEPAAESDEEPVLDNSKIIKDFSETQGIFSKLRPDAVRTLVN